MKPPPVELLHEATLDAELEWLAQVIELRLKHYFDKDSPASPPLPGTALAPPALHTAAGPYAAALLRHGFDADERLLIALALAPTLRPQLLDVLWTRNEVTQRPFTEFGGTNAGAGSFVPTCETACFVLAGDDLGGRLRALRRLAPTQALARADVLSLLAPGAGEAGAPAPSGVMASMLTGALNSALTLTPRFIAEALPSLGHAAGARSPTLAAQVTTGLGWADLVLPPGTLAQLEDIGLWLAHGQTLLHEWGFGRRVGPGYVSLFHGPSGTGKTLSACLIGQRCGREVHRVDLSMTVSKYIGETEKNLARLFDEAERGGWILFFDEADALFGKRTSVSDAHDRYANQEVSYLLQRIEGFDGVVILASNLRHNIDDAFLRRFQSVVPFALPKAPERLRLWREGIPAQIQPAPDLDLPRIAQAFELSGGTIMNVLRYACLCALGRGDRRLRREDVEEGVRRELLKEGRTL